MISQALDKKGHQSLKDAAKVLGISPELLRVTIQKGHIPKDTTLAAIAGKLGIDASSLIMAAHQEKVPLELKGYFLSPSPAQSNYRTGKRTYPLSAEQCAYLGKIMSPEEIQQLRKFRQINDGAQKQLAGYLDFLFATQKSK
jgi:hypothetical protein